MKKKILKLIDLIFGIYSVYFILHTIKIWATGWTLTWLGVTQLILAILLLDILLDEYKKVLKATAKKAFRVLRVNKIFTK